ncbi:MAG TPA: YceI family protein [Myxococcales bacterium]|jgi:polyisoprenoid-binding protein YceI|nr:YceI family protein [Myxococcales bacterium]
MTKIAFAALLATLPLSARAATLNSDPAHSTAGFAVKHMMLTTVRGEFDKFTSTLDWNDADPTKSTVTADIDTASIDTHQEGRDKHVKSPDFLDVEKFPKITFKSTKIEKSSDGYKVTGDLTFHGVTKSITLDAQTDGKPRKSPMGSMVYGVAATGKIKRSDFGVSWNKNLDGGGVLISDEVALELNLEYGAPKAK